MALTAATQENGVSMIDGSSIDYTVDTGFTVYRNALVAHNGTNARPISHLVAGLQFLGVNIRRSVAAAAKVMVERHGALRVGCSAATAAWVGKDAYAIDDNTVTTDPGAVQHKYRVGRIIEVVSATEVLLDVGAAFGLGGKQIKTLVKSFVVGDMTDGGGADGYIDAAALPVGVLVLGWRLKTSVGFTGDTTATAKLGVSGTTDKFSAVTSGSCLAAGTIGSQPKSSENWFQASAVTPRLTITGASDFGLISAGTAVLEVDYIESGN